MKWDNLINTFLKLNSQLNLSSIRDPDGVYQKHILDSLELSNIFPLADNRKVCDIGTWWGFPLLPLAMRYPQVHFIGIDARKKKVEAVNQLIKELNISNAKAVRSRTEDYEWAFDVITARAVGYIDKVIKRSYPLLNTWGHFVFYKQESEEEKRDLLQLCKTKNLTLVYEHHYRLFAGDIGRVIYVIKKE